MAKSKLHDYATNISISNSANEEKYTLAKFDMSKMCVHRWQYYTVAMMLTAKPILT